jgi:hypothetical protein
MNTYLPQILILLGLVFTFLGGLLSTRRTDKLNATNNQIAAENIKLSQSIKDNITGGNSYGDIYPLSLLDGNRTVYVLYFQNRGEFPMSNVVVKYWDPDKTSNNRTDFRVTLQDLDNYTTISLGNVPPKCGASLGSIFTIENGSTKKINISIDAMNGSFSEQLRILNNDGKIAVARKITTITDGTIPSKAIAEIIDSGFPKDEQGKVSWK